MTNTVRRRHKLITDLAVDLANDDDRVLLMLSLLRNGHIGPTPRDDDIHYRDHTGQWGIESDDALALGRRYNTLLEAILDSLKEADSIRRKVIPIGIDRSTVPDPDEWCRNCYQYGYCAPRLAKSRSHYCWWCRDVQTDFGFLPPEQAVRFHHDGERSKAQRELAATRKARKRK